MPTQMVLNSAAVGRLEASASQQHFKRFSTDCVRVVGREGRKFPRLMFSSSCLMLRSPKLMLSLQLRFQTPQWIE